MVRFAHADTGGSAAERALSGGRVTAAAPAGRRVERGLHGVAARDFALQQAWPGWSCARRVADAAHESIQPHNASIHRGRSSRPPIGSGLDLFHRATGRPIRRHWCDRAGHAPARDAYHDDRDLRVELPRAAPPGGGRDAVGRGRARAEGRIRGHRRARAVRTERADGDVLSGPRIRRALQRGRRAALAALGAPDAAAGRHDPVPRRGLVLSAVRETVALVLGLDVSDVSASTSPETAPAWDSVRFVELVFALEDRLGFQFTFDEIARMCSVADIERALEIRSKEEPTAT